MGSWVYQTLQRVFVQWVVDTAYQISETPSHTLSNVTWLYTLLVSEPNRKRPSPSLVVFRGSTD